MNFVGVVEYKILGVNVSEFNGVKYYSCNLSYKSVLDEKGTGTFGSKVITVKCDETLGKLLMDKIDKSIKAVLTQKSYKGKVSNHFAGYEF